MFNYQKRNSPLARTVSIDEVGGAGLYLLSDLSTGVTGEVHFVDSGYNIVSMPRLDELKDQDKLQEEESGLTQAASIGQESRARGSALSV